QVKMIWPPAAAGRDPAPPYSSRPRPQARKTAATGWRPARPTPAPDPAARRGRAQPDPVAGSPVALTMAVWTARVALLPAHADHLITPVKRVLRHVLPEFSGGPDDANLHVGGVTGFSPVLCCFHVFFPRVWRLPIQDEPAAQLSCRVTES